MNKTILALDLGAKTGYSLWGLYPIPGMYFLIASGVIDVTHKRPSHPKGIVSQGSKYLRLIVSLKEIIDLSLDNQAAIFYEKVHNHVGVYAAHKYGAYEACTNIFSELHKLPEPIGIPVGVWKKDIIGKGNANKAEIRDTVVDLIWTDKLTFPNFDTNKLEKITYDECDAIAIGLHACKQQKD